MSGWTKKRFWQDVYRGSDAEEQLNHSIEVVEYNFADAIRKLNLENRKSDWID